MKKFLALLLSAVMALGLLTACGNNDTPSVDGENPGNASTEAIKLKIAHGASESYHLHRAVLKFKEYVEGTGLFSVEIYPNQQCGSDDEMIEGVQTGDLTFCISPSSFLADMSPMISLIELPYIFPSRDAAVATLRGEWGQVALESLDEIGLHGINFMENGVRNVTNSKREIRVPADMKGLKMRTMQVPAHVNYWNSLGCSAEGSAFSELYTNLSTGVFDGEENPIAHIYANKFYEVQPYISITEHVYCAYIPLCTTDFWNSLNDEQKTVLEEGFEIAYNAQMEMVENETADQLKEMEDYGCTVTYLTDDEKALWIESAQPILQQYHDSVGDEIYNGFETAIAEAAASLK